MKRANLILLIGILVLLGAAGGAVIYLSDWKRRAELNAGDPLYGQLMAMLAAAETQFGIPTDLLARQAYEESSFLPNIINGQQASSAGALGLMQFEPATATALGVNPLDPQSAITGAASLMSQLYSQFGAWSLALAAYDAGPAAVIAAGNNVPAFPETQNYVAQILADVNAEGGAQIS